MAACVSAGSVGATGRLHAASIMARMAVMIKAARVLIMGWCGSFPVVVNGSEQPAILPHLPLACYP